MNVQFAAVLRLARGLRLLRLVTALPRLQLLVGALLKSLGAMGYVGLLLALMFYIYGVAGVHLFRQADASHFGSLPAALLSLFQVPIGLVIAFIGLRLALGQKPHLPLRLMQKELPPRIVLKVLGASSRIVAAFERLSKPRLQLFYRHAAFQCIGGALIPLCGLKLLLPLPVPMSNFFPGVSAALLAAGSFEEDGLVYLAGLVMFVVSLACFALLAFGGAAALSGIWQRVLGG